MTGHRACPSCGEKLQPIDVDAQTPPWLCEPCSRAWWNAELEAAAEYDPATRDFGASTPEVLAAAEDELTRSLYDAERE